VDEYYVWVTTRRITLGARRDFEQAWRPPQAPAGMVRAYELWSEDDVEIVGVSVWESRDACEAYRASDAEALRRAAMATFVLDESSSTYTGRELALPGA
jgi:heme-degrading monooxygenase HmoA